ncbi:hypothetical protein K402DRAFT_413360 [Aulographum hederae CBS 113979]|uniref:Dynactin subunit 4 n=1 Tax=Aulographum hederae CBS 113979 TaxID=1176131 RepID=A0A6G1GWQ4_9PEZI|nr:hypothetical protein K402DRAFT_413360 [Aulographum hederae CBS 113979]
MAQSFPYTYYRCPCVDTSTPTSAVAPPNLPSDPSSAPVEQDEEEGHTFDPLSPRANFSLFPLEHLLYCTECHEIRCPRCTMEEIISYYCPNCLFEAGSSSVKEHGNRCIRNCFNCPTCTAPLSVNAMEMERSNGSDTGSSASEQSHQYFLSCPYCNWSSLEIDMDFKSPQNIYHQFTKFYRSQPDLESKPSQVSPTEAMETPTQATTPVQQPPTPTAHPTDQEHYARLTAFLRTQISDTDTNSYNDINFSSPSSITRLMHLYNPSSKKAALQKPALMREAQKQNEGLVVQDLERDQKRIQEIRFRGWDGTISLSQRSQQQHPRNIHFDTDLRPVPTLLICKRSKRCRTCRSVLFRPESKPTSTRFKIKLLALEKIPRLSLRALNAATVPAALITSVPSSSPLITAAQGFDYNALKPLKPTLFLLTLSNPLEDPVKVTLATPGVSKTAAGVESKVTILCPQFEVGANTDVWDEALNPSTRDKEREREAKRRSALLTLSSGSAESMAEAQAGVRQAEAGKIWSSGRNWTSVIVEVVPNPTIDPSAKSRSSKGRGNEDDDVLEIPVFVRMEYEADAHGDGDARLDDSTSSARRRGEKEKLEEAFWCVFGVGRVVGL